MEGTGIKNDNIKIKRMKKDEVKKMPLDTLKKIFFSAENKKLKIIRIEKIEILSVRRKICFRFITKTSK